jgi:hypothetical protein
MASGARSNPPAPKFAGMTRLGPGIYDDEHGTVHVDAQEMCAHFGVPCTDDNFKVLLRGIFEAADELDIESVQVTR